LSIKEQETHLTLQEHDDDDDIFFLHFSDIQLVTVLDVYVFIIVLYVQMPYGRQKDQWNCYVRMYVCMCECSYVYE